MEPTSRTNVGTKVGANKVSKRCQMSKKNKHLDYGGGLQKKIN